jgi:aminobenzoyl-glutamate utilization protein B
MSQDALPAKQPREEGKPGHACGHHLFGTASVAAAIALKDWLQTGKRQATIRVYGTPAEEGGSGKVYMVREGLFKDVDVALSWHPGDRNSANPSSTLANISAKFRFTGMASHAAMAPERGRSALDGIEAMDAMVNMMREHTTESTRIHYIITKGGDAPNIVPATGEVYYLVRHEDREEVRSLFGRIVKCAEGAALGTETSMNYEIISGAYDKLPNETLARVMRSNLVTVGGMTYDASEIKFAETLRKSLSGTLPPLEIAATIEPFETHTTKASSDVGDVSWNVPTVEMTAATWVPGTPAHSWQAVACGGMSIGFKGMMIAAKTLALTAVDLIDNPAILIDAKKEFDKHRGPDFQYKALLGDRAPALDYRDK